MTDLGVPPEPPVHVLLSGGMDSAACVAFHLAAGRKVIGMFADYGQAAAHAEQAAARRVAGHYGISLRVLTLAGGRGTGAGLIPGRNGFLIFAALLDIGPARATIAIGVHAGTTFHDCSLDFIERMDDLAGACSGGNVRVDAPFADAHKYQVYEYARLHGVPLELTYSCEQGTEPPCGSCLSCMDVVLDRRAQERKAKAGPLTGDRGAIHVMDARRRASVLPGAPDLPRL